MSLIIPANSAAASGGYAVANSCRFNDGSSDSLTKSLGTPTSTKIGTFSCWVKLGNVTTEQTMLGAYADSSNRHHIEFQADHNIEIFGKASNSTNMSLITNAFFRDVSAWYNIVVAYDTSQGTDSNRVKLYVNGTQVTSFATETYPDQNTVLQFNTDGSTIAVGRNQGGNYADGYMCEVVFIDGQQLAPTSFGEFDEDSGIWKPIDVSGLTFGTNGFYLDFEASGNLGNDANGGTDLTENNLTAVDQSIDTCTNNFCTFMSHTSGSYATLSEGGLISTGNSASDSGSSIASMGITNGKWYWEFEFDTQNSGYGVVGAIDTTAAKFGIQGGAVGYPVPDVYAISVGGNMSDGGVSSEESGWASDYSNGDVLGMAFDMDNGAWYLHLNGTYYDSGDPTSAGSKTGAVVGWTPNGKTLVPVVTSYNGSIEKFNFGSPPYAISSGNQDGDGYGNFEYAVPSGYFSLNTKNLAEYG